MPRDMLPLAPYRALDLTEDGALLCGRMLADLGADVVQVEPLGGSPTRRLGPFYQDDPHPDRSLFWFAYCANKRSVTLKVETADGRALLRRLVESAHFLIESFSPDYLESLGLGYQALREINPGLIMVSITPFGKTGPYASYKGPDLVAMALGGMVWLTGDPDRPPLRVGFPQAHLSAAASAAVGAMTAHYHWLRTGYGQHVDASAQQSVVRSLAHAPQIWYLNRQVLHRQGISRPQHGGQRQRTVWPCKDGYISYTVSLRQSGGQNIWSLIAWMDEEGADTEYLKGIDWEETGPEKATQEFLERVESAVEPFFQAHTKRELWEGAVGRRILLYPLSSPRDLLENTQLEARGYFQSVPHPELGQDLTYPGPAVQATGVSLGVRQRAPLVGEHNGEVYGELGLSPEELATLHQAGVV